MVTFLAKLFIGNKDLNKADMRRAYGMLCGFLGIGLNIMLFVFKLIAGLISNSASITADAFNNLSDAGSSVVSLIGFKLAAGKADAEHPYGHGRIEYIAGMIVSFLIMIMAIELIQTSFQKVMHPEPTEFSLIILAILLVSIAVKVYMITYNTVIGKKIDSPSMKATAADSLGDVIATSVVLLCSVISYFTGLLLDGYCGIAVGLFILYSGFSSARETVSPLLGKAPSREYLDRIKSIVLSDPSIIGVHDLIVHDYGPMQTMISLHAEVPAEASFIHVHDVIDAAEKRLCAELGCEAVIHIDPYVKNRDMDSIRERIRMIMGEMNGKVSFHDLHILNEDTPYPILAFDVLVPMEYEKSDDEIVTYIIKELSELLDNKYTPMIKIDRDYGK